MSNVINFNPNPGVDYHLRALGIERRADWEFVARDDQTFGNEFAVCRPDIVLRHKPSDQYVALEYKSWRLGDGEPGKQECWQALINAVLVGSDIYRSRQLTDFPEVAAVVMYGDGQQQQVTYDDDDVQFVYEAMVELSPLGHDAEGNRARLSASEMAMQLAGNHPLLIWEELPDGSMRLCLDGTQAPEADGSRLMRRRRGTRAHEALRNFGPEITDR